MAWARRHKYNAKKTHVDGITFASKAEAAAYGQLKISQEQGMISDLQLQPRFLLQESFKDSEGVAHRAIHYVADFSFKRGAHTVVVDVKGMETDTWKLKKKMFLYQHPNVFLEVWKMFHLRDVVTYIAKRIGLIPGRVWFSSGNGFNVKLTAQQRRNFLRFLNRHELKQFLVLDDFHKKQPVRPAGVSMDVPGRVEGRDVESAVSAPGRA